MCVCECFLLLVALLGSVCLRHECLCLCVGFLAVLVGHFHCPLAMTAVITSLHAVVNAVLLHHAGCARLAAGQPATVCCKTPERRGAIACVGLKRQTGGSSCDALRKALLALVRHCRPGHKIKRGGGGGANKSHPVSCVIYTNQWVSQSER